MALNFFQKETHFDFVGLMPKAVSASVGVVVLSALALLVLGLNYGIDFSGGTEMQLKFDKPVPVGDLRAAVEAMGYEKNVIQSAGSGDTDYVVRVDRFAAMSKSDIDALRAKLDSTFPGKLTTMTVASEAAERFTLKFSDVTTADDVKNAFIAAGQATAAVEKLGRDDEYIFAVNVESLSAAFVKSLSGRLGGVNVTVQGVESVGSEVGSQLREDGVLAMLYAIIGIVVYVMFRFDSRFAPGALLGLAHDAIITLGVFAVFRVEFNMAALAAVLTVVGYSINDTIIVFDRIREVMDKSPDAPLEKVINVATNSMISRTALTGGTTLLVTLTLTFLGGQSLFGFGIAMTLGVIIGTYSSIYVAAPLIIFLQRRLGWGLDAAKPRTGPKEAQV